MKPYQFYKVTAFPTHRQGEPFGNDIQTAFLGEAESISTRLTLTAPGFEGDLDQYRIVSEVKHSALGFIKHYISENEERKKVQFSEYLEPVDYFAFYSAPRQIIAFQAKKETCKGVIGNLRANPCGVVLQEMVVDFKEVLSRCREYQGAWFRNVSTRVRAAALSGDEIQNDALFINLLAAGDLSNVTIPWSFEEGVHSVMITSTAAICLLHDYPENQGFELRLIMNVFDDLLSKVWGQKKDGRRRSDS
jgi:hypothetical protein